VRIFMENPFAEGATGTAQRREGSGITRRQRPKASESARDARAGTPEPVLSG